jgi:Fe-S cluster assembly ATP-binding protein
MTPMLSVRNLRVSSEKKNIISGISFDVVAGDVVALMGPNGSGKSTLAYTLMGHPRYDVTNGTVEFCDSDLLKLSPEQRAKAGLFLSFQYPQEIAGVPLGNFLRRAHAEVTGSAVPISEFLRRLHEMCDRLGVDRSFVDRPVNEGFSGGEKKRAEILQLAILEPKLAILDETDSGLDADALRVVAKGIEAMRKDRPDMAILLITHYERFLEFLSPSRVLVMKNGSIAAEGGKDLADRIQKEGYEGV